MRLMFRDWHKKGQKYTQELKQMLTGFLIDFDRPKYEDCGSEFGLGRYFIGP